MKQQENNKILEKALQIVSRFLCQKYSQKEISVINVEIEALTGKKVSTDVINMEHLTYESVQNFLLSINEKGEIRKDNGVYYTPEDIVNFILTNGIKSSFDILKPINMHVTDLNGVPFKKICYEKEVLDPTCGTGAFLLPTLELKLDLLELHHEQITSNKIKNVLKTINGNDLDKISTSISKLRLFLEVLNRYGSKKVTGISKILNSCFTNFDFVNSSHCLVKKYDLIVGNPPYVEDAKSQFVPETRFGNIYANVLWNSSQLLSDGGVMGFIIPLSYVSTPRMKKIRELLNSCVPEQYILSYADRPACLFTSVHQKLSILIAKHSKCENKIVTGNYTYWYSQNRENLFKEIRMIVNKYACDDYIPKLGTSVDEHIYKKIQMMTNPIYDLMTVTGVPIYVNLRAAFWIKAFSKNHIGSEYKKFECENETLAKYIICLLNSSLFWWYWICVSDCWHITKKELLGFKVPMNIDNEKVTLLANNLESKLEKTKQYIGSKQVDYEYKHKECIYEISQIDDYINELFGLNEKESLYIKNFAFQYRTGGSAA